jgi:hypothetical protein
MMPALVAAGAEVDPLGHRLSTPLHFAVSHRDASAP